MPESQDSIVKPVLVTAREHLEEVVEELKVFPQLAIDTESNGFYAYREKVCLVQISSPEMDYIVDPIAISDFSSLGPLFANPAIEKIFHAGEYDVLSLKRDYGFCFANLFDTMISGRLLGAKELGLAKAIETYFGITLSKKLQRADWARRPLTPEHIRYAQLDTHYLIALSDIQKGLLKKKGRDEDAAEAFADLAALEPNPKDFDPQGYWRLSGGRLLSGMQRSCLKEIYLFREEEARRRDRAPFRVMSEDLMMRVAEAMPENEGDLSRVKGMTPYLIEKFGRALLAAVELGRNSQPLTEEPRVPGRQRRDAKEWKLFERLREWRKAQAEREGVDPVVIVSSSVLHEISRAATSSDKDPLQILSPLKRGRYAEQILKIIKSC